MAEDMRRYKPDFSGFDVEPLRQFCQDFVDGNLKVWIVIHSLIYIFIYGLYH